MFGSKLMLAAAAVAMTASAATAAPISASASRASASELSVAKAVGTTARTGRRSGDQSRAFGAGGAATLLPVFIVIAVVAVGIKFASDDDDSN